MQKNILIISIVAIILLVGAWAMFSFSTKKPTEELSKKTENSIDKILAEREDGITDWLLSDRGDKIGKILTFEFISDLDRSATSQTPPEEKREEAHDVAVKALKEVESRYESNDPWVARFKILLAKTCTNYPEDFCDAIQLISEVFVIQETNKDIAHPITLSNLENISAFYEQNSYPGLLQKRINADELLLAEYLKMNDEKLYDIATARIGLAVSYSDIGDYDKALIYLNEALDDIEENNLGDELLSKVYENKSEIYSLTSESDLAASEIEKYTMLQDNIDDSYAQFDIARRYVDSGNDVQASKVYSAIVENNLNSSDTGVVEKAKHGLAKSEARLGNIRDAEKLYVEIIKMTNEKNYIYMLELADIYENRGDNTATIYLLKMSVLVFEEMGGVADDQKAEAQDRIESLQNS